MGCDLNGLVIISNLTVSNTLRRTKMFVEASKEAFATLTSKFRGRSNPGGHWGGWEFMTTLRSSSSGYKGGGTSGQALLGIGHTPSNGVENDAVVEYEPPSLVEKVVADVEGKKDVKVADEKGGIGTEGVLGFEEWVMERKKWGINGWIMWVFWNEV